MKSGRAEVAKTNGLQLEVDFEIKSLFPEN